MRKGSILCVALIFFTLSGKLVVGDRADQTFENGVFKEVERIELKLDNLVFARIPEIDPLPDGYILLVNESAYGKQYALVKVSRQGSYVSMYDKRGNGPGELRSIESIAVQGDSILVSEVSAPFIHEFSNNLEFVKDHRIKMAGTVIPLGKYIGVWALNYRKVDNKNRSFILTLYDRNTFEFERVAFEVTDVPPFVFTWGGICRVSDTLYAGVYCNQYQIFLFDNEFNSKKTLLKKVPGHIKQYRSTKMDPHTLNQKGVNWIHSWSKVQFVYFVENRFIIGYNHDKESFLDVYSRDGKPLVQHHRMKKNRGLNFATESQYIWALEWNEDRDRYTIVKLKLDLD